MLDDCLYCWDNDLVVYNTNDYYTLSVTLKNREPRWEKSYF